MAEIGGALDPFALIVCGICWLAPVFVSQHFTISDLDALTMWIEQPLGGVLILTGFLKSLREY